MVKKKKHTSQVDATKILLTDLKRVGIWVSISVAITVSVALIVETWVL